MTYFYRIGATRWRRYVHGEPRGFSCPKGWEAEAVLIDIHPTTGKQFRNSQWWIRERFTRE